MISQPAKLSSSPLRFGSDHQGIHQPAPVTNRANSGLVQSKSDIVWLAFRTVVQAGRHSQGCGSGGNPSEKLRCLPSLNCFMES
ncbi:hypothetical protein ACOSQ3_018029 [Xanthoceras sorbifolium]